jgi:hypothetical protein
MKPAGTFVFLLFSLFSCKETPFETPVRSYVRTIDLTVVDTGLTDAYLRVKFLDKTQPRSFRVHRDGRPVLTVNDSPADTVIVQDSLSLNRTYVFRAYRLQDTQVIDSSLAVQPKTLDSTNHDFIFQTFALSFPESRYEDYLQDVVIVNDTLAYACGAVYARDSLGYQDQNAYNLARWNGHTWELIRIWFNMTCGQPAQRSYRACSIFAFGPTDVWIATRGSQIAHWNGTIQTATICVPDSLVINRIWVENPSSIYVVGEGGRISHYANGVWQSLESGTTMPILDIYGARDDRNNTYEILCVASGSMERKILQIQGSSVTEIPNYGLGQTVRAVWHIPGRLYMIGGSSVYYVRRLGEVWKNASAIPQFLSARTISGTALNDVVLYGGSYGLNHFNGSTWYHYTVGYTWFVKVSMKGNMIIAVGGVEHGLPGSHAIASSYAIAMIGRR